MKVKLLEHYQDANVHYVPEQVVNVDEILGSWLLEHRKAVRVPESKPLVTGKENEPIAVEDASLHTDEEKSQHSETPKRGRRQA